VSIREGEPITIAQVPLQAYFNKPNFRIGVNDSFTPTIYGHAGGLYSSHWQIDSDSYLARK